MPSKVFSYVEDGLSYSVTVYEGVDENGAPKFYADITVDEGAMDVNAIYFGDDEFSGDDAGLKGPLNMNGGGSQLDGEAVQWDSAEKLSDPGLGREGTDKETYLAEGNTLTVELDIASLDEIDVFGVRATSTTTGAGSIKGVSGDPEEPVDPEEPTYDKVFFDSSIEHGDVYIGTEPNESNTPVLPEDQEPTFEDYLSYYETVLNGDVATLEGVAFYEIDDEGNPQELFRIEAPEGGFENSDELLDAYDAALEEMEGAEAFEGADLIAALSLPDESDDDAPADQVDADAEEPELV